MFVSRKHINVRRSSQMSCVFIIEYKYKKKNKRRRRNKKKILRIHRHTVKPHTRLLKASISKGETMKPFSNLHRMIYNLFLARHSTVREGPVYCQHKASRFFFLLFLLFFCSVPFLSRNKNVLSKARRGSVLSGNFNRHPPEMFIF